MRQILQQANHSAPPTPPTPPSTAVALADTHRFPGERHTTCKPVFRLSFVGDVTLDGQAFRMTQLAVSASGETTFSTARRHSAQRRCVSRTGCERGRRLGHTSSVARLYLIRTACMCLHVLHACMLRLRGERGWMRVLSLVSLRKQVQLPDMSEAMVPTKPMSGDMHGTVRLCEIAECAV